MLDKPTLKYLKENNYHFEKNLTGFCFKRKRDWSWLIITGGFIGLIIFIVNIRDPWAGFIGCSCVLLAVLFLILVVKNKPFLEINHYDSTLRIGMRCVSLNMAESIKIESKLVAEYTSAFKETSQEFRTTINLQLEDRETILLFKFKTDYQEPSEPINGLYQFLKSSLKGVEKKYHSLAAVGVISSGQSTL